jgi:hypothetical protein
VALSLLPPDVPLASVAPFLTAALRHGSDSARTLSAAASLASVRVISVRSSLADRQARAVTIEKTSLCAACGRRLAIPGKLAPSALAVYPTGAVVHATCCEEGGQGGRREAAEAQGGGGDYFG